MWHAKPKVTFTTYTDDACTQVASTGGASAVVDLTLDSSCNETPDSSISELICYEDGIVYYNHPNTDDCSADPICNSIPIGVCTYFTGPFDSVHDILTHTSADFFNLLLHLYFVLIEFKQNDTLCDMFCLVETD